MTDITTVETRLAFLKQQYITRAIDVADQKCAHGGWIGGTVGGGFYQDPLTELAGRIRHLEEALKYARELERDRKADEEPMP